MFMTEPILTGLRGTKITGSISYTLVSERQHKEKGIDWEQRDTLVLVGNFTRGFPQNSPHIRFPSTCFITEQQKAMQDSTPSYEQ
jgi:hypothetical protein